MYAAHADLSHSLLRLQLKMQTFHETQFETLIRNEVMTRALFRPHSLDNNMDLFDRLPDCRASAAPESRSVLVIGHELNRTRAFVAFTIAALLTLGIGIGVGAATDHLELGPSIGAAVFGCLAIVQVAIIWTNK